LFACDDQVVDSLSLCVLLGLGRGQRLAVGRNRHSRRDGHLATYLTNDFVGAAIDAFLAIGTVRR
jgi:hypothetical protein